jgi:hypothetical protein
MVTGVAPASFSAGPQLQPQYDPIELLPERAQNLLRKLRDRATDAHAICVPFADIQEASAARIAAENRLRQLTDHPQNHGHNLPTTDARVVTQQRLVNKLTDDFRRLQERSETKAAAWRSASQALAAVESWLRDGKPHGTVLEDHEGPEPRLNKGEAGLLDAVENRRRRCRELRADLHRVASAPYPSSHAKQRMRGMIEALAQRGQPDVSLLIEHDSDIVWPTKRVKVEVLNAQPGAIGFAEIPDMLAIDAWRNKDATLAKLDAEINTEADDGCALTHEQRQQAEAQTMSDLIDIERQEATLVFAAWEHGLACEHRGDINPVALLGVRLVTLPRATELPPSSPERAGFNLIGGR